MGMPGWQLGAPRFEDVEVPAENLIGREGDGFRIAMATFDRSRPTVAAQAVGLGQGAIDLAVDYATRREAFGKPLMAHQGVQFKLADMEADVAAARALTFQAATAVDEDDPRLTKLAAMAKMKASDAAMRVTTEAVQVLGGNGYLKDFPAERMMRDAKVLQIYEGANEIQRVVIAGAMAKQAADREPMWPECMPAPRARRGSGRRGQARRSARRPSAHRGERLGDRAVGLAVEGQADVAAGHLDVARVGDDARLPPDDAVAARVDRGQRDLVRERRRRSGARRRSRSAR